MIRVVLDTNVYISALNFGGLPLEILVLGIRKEISIFISPAILKEIEKVLLRKFKWPTKQVQEALTMIQEFAESVSPKEKVDLIKEDEPDNRVLECAQEAKAHVIISGDSDLRDLKDFRGILILSPREFVESKMWL